MKIKLITVMKAKQFNLSNGAYANTLGITKEQLDGWYSGKITPTAHSAFKICKALNLTDRQTTTIMNQLDTVRARKRRAKRKNNASPKQRDKYKALAENFVRAGRKRGLTINELVEQTNIGSRVSLNRYRSGERVPKARERGIMERFIKNTTPDLIEIEVPKETPTDYSIIAEYVWQISKYRGHSLEELYEELGVGSNSTMRAWRLGISIPRFDGHTNLIEYVDAYNELIPVEKRIDPYDLIPPRPKLKRIRLKDYGPLHKIERLYGSVGNIPDKHPLLTELQKEWGII